MGGASQISPGPRFPRVSSVSPSKQGPGVPGGDREGRGHPNPAHLFSSPGSHVTGAGLDWRAPFYQQGIWSSSELSDSVKATRQDQEASAAGWKAGSLNCRAVHGYQGRRSPALKLFPSRVHLSHLRGGGTKHGSLWTPMTLSSVIAPSELKGL